MQSNTNPMHTKEHSEQANLITWWSYTCKFYQIPEHLLFAIPNGSPRGDTPKTCAIRGHILKQEGVRRGIPDLLFAVQRGGKAGLFIEMKSKTGFCSKEQKEMHELLKEAGYEVVVARGAQAAKKAIENYLQLDKTEDVCTF